MSSTRAIERSQKLVPAGTGEGSAAPLLSRRRSPPGEAGAAPINPIDPAVDEANLETAKNELKARKRAETAAVRAAKQAHDDRLTQIIARQSTAAAQWRNDTEVGSAFCICARL